VNLKLITRIQPNQLASGHTSHDEMASTVERFCRLCRLPYSDIFTSIFVYGQSEDHNAAAAQLGYGTAYRLNEEIVIPRLEIVCTGDIQTVASNALRNQQDRNKLNNYRNMFTDLRTFTNEEKYAALLRALERRAGPYVETRMFGALSDEDILGRA
jgi:hypothetical protein